jgi:hypothetical protein
MLGHAVFLGSRSLPRGGAASVAAVARGVITAGWSVSVGCASGADRAAVRSVLAAGAAERLQVFAVGGHDGSGFAGRASAVCQVIAANLAGASVRWWAGGPVARPLKSRLVGRSIACVRSSVSAGCSGGVVLGAVGSLPPRPFAAPSGAGLWWSCGSGSWSALGVASLLGVPRVLVLPVGRLAELAPEALPTLPGGPGHWSAVSSGLFAGAYEWAPDSCPF